MPPREPFHILVGGAFDTRAIGNAQIFFAWKGRCSDGHHYIDQLNGTSIRLAVIEREVPTIGELALLKVSDSLQALQNLASKLAAEFKGKIISITGSCGKTTAKTWLEHLLSARFRVLCSEKSFNNSIGCPTTVMHLRAEHDVIVLEMGTSGTGELEMLSGLFPADISVLLNVGHAHLGKFGSREAIYRGKTEIFSHHRKDATFLIPFQDTRIREFMPSMSYSFFGKGSPQFSWKLDAVDAKRHRQSFTFQTPEGARTAWVNQLGNHVGETLSALMAICHQLGMDWEDIASRLETLPQEKGRSIVSFGIHHVTILDDTYNANPESVVNMLHTLCSLKARRYVGVIGNLAELEADLSESANVVVENIPSRLTHLILTGETGKILSKLIEKRYSALETIYLESLVDVIDRARRYCDDSTAIGVKGSRSAHMERVVHALFGKKVSCDLAVCGLLQMCSGCEKL